MNAIAPTAEIIAKNAMAVDAISASLPRDGKFNDFIMGMVHPSRREPEEKVRETLEKAMEVPNAIAKAFRENSRGLLGRKFPEPRELLKSGALAKSVLDVGTLTNMANITGGQTLGYVSLDTQMARGTVRPSSFTLYQCLKKTAAFQVVDYWPYTDDLGGGIPGTAFQSFGNVASGTLSTNAGRYQLNNITLKLALDGRAITTALAAQNSFVDVVAQENANAALTVLQSINWALYYGDSSVFPNQFDGLYKSTSQYASGNIFDFQTFKTAKATSQGWSDPQTLYNLIYEAAAQITSWWEFGRITHAFMAPNTNASLQGLVSTTLNNILTNLTSHQDSAQGIVINGDLQGMRTRFGEIQFPIDMFISARNIPAQAMVRQDGTNPATTTAPTKPVAVTVAVATGTVANSAWSSSFIATGAGGAYAWAVASLDAAMNESTLTYSNSTSGVILNGSATLTIQPPASADAYAFRVYRSGKGYGLSSGQNPASFRYIGVVLASGSSNVTYTDLNARIPNSEDIFLLDFDEADHALDYRFLLPLTRIELFAQNLYMPWAVAHIGAVRNRIPKFHGIIKNFVPLTPTFDPLQPNY